MRAHKSGGDAAAGAAVVSVAGEERPACEAPGLARACEAASARLTRSAMPSSAADDWGLDLDSERADAEAADLLEEKEEDEAEAEVAASARLTRSAIFCNAADDAGLGANSEG